EVGAESATSAFSRNEREDSIMPIHHRCCRCHRLYPDDQLGVGNTLVCPTCHDCLTTQTGSVGTGRNGIDQKIVPARAAHLHIVRPARGSHLVHWPVTATAAALVLLLTGSAVGFLAVRQAKLSESGAAEALVANLEQLENSIRANEPAAVVDSSVVASTKTAP